MREIPEKMEATPEKLKLAKLLGKKVEVDQYGMMPYDFILATTTLIEDEDELEDIDKEEKGK